MKLARKDLAAYRAKQLEQQQGLCALCLDPIDGDAVLDHDHSTGLVRRVLHRGCNCLLGKIERNLKRNRVDSQRLQTFSRELVSYIETQHTELLHPTHKELNMGRGRGRGRRPPKR